jgi:hypothetical protein
MSVACWLITGVVAGGACTDANSLFRRSDGGGEPVDRDGAPAAALPELVGWWKFDDGPGSTRSLDSSGLGNSGALEGLAPAQAWVAGKHGGALSFPPGMQSAGIQVVPSPSLRALRRITVAAWIKRVASDVAVEPQSAIVSQQDDDDPRAESFTLEAYREHLEAFIATSDAAQTTGSGPLGVLSQGTGTRQVWMHVAMTFNGSTLRLYRNGLEVGAAAITRPLLPTGKPFYLGTNKNGAVNQPFEGLLDDIVICADALSADAVAALAADADPSSVCRRSQ